MFQDVKHMEILKLVITGAYAAGKTQFIQTVSEIEVVETEVPVSVPDELERKDHTTVAFDFGTLRISDEANLYLFGTPGQDRFDFMWDILALGALGYVLMVDSTRPAHLREAQRIIDHFATNQSSLPFIVVCNKQDDPTSMPPEYIERRLKLPPGVPVVGCVATDQEKVKEVLLTLLELIYSLVPVTVGD
jgi:uncharacterized protein